MGWAFKLGKLFGSLSPKKPTVIQTTTKSPTVLKTTTKAPTRISAMRDKVSVARLDKLHPYIRESVEALIIRAETKLPKKLAIRIVQGLRTIEEQNELYKLGRSKINPDGKSAKKPMGNIVTNAKGGQSYHNYGLAIDFAILVDKDGNGTYDELSWDIKKDNDKDGVADWYEVAKVFEDGGFEWGGKWSSFKDYPHIQKTFGYTTRQLAVKYNNNDFITGTKYVKLR